MTHSDDHLFYDGSFNGFLTLLFDVAYRDLHVSSVSRKESGQDALFPQPDFIETRPKDAHQLWQHMRARNYSALKTLYFGFMSGHKNVENLLLSYFKDWFGGITMGSNITYDRKYSELYRLAGEVEKEKNALERKLLLFEGTEDCCIRLVRPKYNVLPLISKYLRTRFRKNEWFVFDLNRKYGLHHKEGDITFIPLRKEHLRQTQRSEGVESTGKARTPSLGVAV